jgi:hypothetical protein
MRHLVSFMIFFLLIGLMAQGCARFEEVAERPVAEVPETFADGVLLTEFRADPLRTYNAAWAALADFNMNVTASKRDSTGGYIEAVQPDGRKVTLSLRAKNQTDTTVAVRVGDLGDEELSRAISRRIMAHLR